MGHPRLTDRPSFAERDAYRDVLSRGFAEGRVDDAAFSARMHRLEQAETLRVMERQISDLPRGGLTVPEDAGIGAAHRKAMAERGAPEPRRNPRWGLIYAGAAVMGLLAGLAAVGMHSQPGAAPSLRGDSAEAEYVEPEHVRLAFESLEEETAHLSVLSIARRYATAHVPVEGDRYDSVTVSEIRGVSRDPGGTYREGQREAETFELSTVDTAAVERMLEAAADVFSEETGMEGGPVQRIWIQRDAGSRQHAGVEPDAVFVRVQLAETEYGDGGGSVVWTADGRTLVAVEQ